MTNAATLITFWSHSFLQHDFKRLFLTSNYSSVNMRHHHCVGTEASTDLCNCQWHIWNYFYLMLCTGFYSISHITHTIGVRVIFCLPHISSSCKLISRNFKSELGEGGGPHNHIRIWRHNVKWRGRLSFLFQRCQFSSSEMHIMVIIRVDVARAISIKLDLDLIANLEEIDDQNGVSWRFT